MFSREFRFSCTSGTNRRLGGWQNFRSAEYSDRLARLDSGQQFILPGRPSDGVNGVSPIHGDYRDTLQYLNSAAFPEVPISDASGAQLESWRQARHNDPAR